MNSLAAAVKSSVLKYSNRPCLSDAHENWTYQQLQMCAEQVQQSLLQIHFDPNETCGIYLPKRPATVGAVIGALWAQLPFVPLDVESPFTRVKFIIEDAACQLIITNSSGSDLLRQEFEDLTEVTRLSDYDLVLLELVHRPASSKVLPSDLAYILYTSGSTGHPKGVLITHENALSFVNWGAQTFQITLDDYLVSIAPFHFDLSVFDIYVSLMSGARLYLLEQKSAGNPLLVAKILAQERITSMYATPSFLQLLLRYGRLNRYDFSALRQVLFAGEVFPIPSLKTLTETWHQTRFYNLYGPTETNVVTFFEVPNPLPDQQTAPFPIGKLCPFAVGRIVQGNEFLPIQPKASGELWISGATVSPGYVGGGERNQAVFFQDQEQRWYKTGDLVEVDTEGQIVYRGRKDRMVKRRGYRIELGEVERAAVSLPALAEVAAVAVELDEQPRIILFYVLANEGEPIAESLLKQQTSEILPKYFLPDRYLPLPALPQTSSQKIDYQILTKKAQADVENG